MNNKQVLLLALLASTPSAYLQARAPQQNSLQPFFQNMFNDFDTFFDQQINMMENMRQAMQSSSRQTQQTSSVHMREEDNALIITIMGINIDRPDAIHAGIEPDKPDMLITLPAGEIHMQAHMHGNHPVISVYGQHRIEEVQETQEEQDTMQAPQRKQSSTYVSQFSMQQMVSKSVNFENQTITYDGDAKTLTIQLPFVEAKHNLKPIHVNFKE